MRERIQFKVLQALLGGTVLGIIMTMLWTYQWPYSVYLILAVVQVSLLHWISRKLENEVHDNTPSGLPREDFDPTDFIPIVSGATVEYEVRRVIRDAGFVQFEMLYKASDQFEANPIWRTHRIFVADHFSAPGVFPADPNRISIRIARRGFGPWRTTNFTCEMRHVP